MPFLDRGAQRLYFECHGDGPPVLFLHGAGSNAATWWQQLPRFAARHACVTLDLRCFGRSAAPLSGFTYGYFVDDVLALLDHLRLPRVMLVGQSLGGMVGLRLALQHPQRVAGFAACDSLLGVDLPALTEPFRRRPASAAGVQIEQRALGPWFRGRHPARAALYAQINAFNPSAHSVPAPDWQAALRALTDAAQLLPLAALDTLQVPTLFLVGRDDPLVPPAALAQVLARVAGSEFRELPNAGHSAYFEQPEAFNDCVLDFIARRVFPPAGVPAARTATTTGDER